LRNLTQAYVAKELGLSLAGYGKIERDETEITVHRLKQIAVVLNTDLSTILNFDSNQVFNQYNNKTATANGVVQNQQIIGDNGLQELFTTLKADIKNIITRIDHLEQKS